uniref:Competence protein ComEC n=1 Tax=Candidatus Kentrum sp. DK TaxID=2126562 RepID=A0A450TDK8_9GAMM|nr:MAG: competence protein ComEC [Candidatus Kentron sp. DK]
MTFSYRAAAIAFLSGILLLAALPDLPNPLLAWLLPGAILLALSRSSALRLVAWFGMGFTWALLRAGMGLADILPVALEGQDVTCHGVIASLPVETGHKTRFLLDIIRVEETPAPAPATREKPTADPWGPGRRARLNWYHRAPRLLPGETWRLTVRLKRPRGFRNPGGFDYERWLFQQGIHATGYVRSAPGNGKIPGHGRISPDSVRYRLARKIDKALGGASHAGIVKALAIGVRDGITEDQWATLRATGTAHLMAISGLHIGLVTTLIFFLTRALWARLPGMPLLIPAQRMAAPIAALGALGYAALAGFSLPTQRALVMVCVVMAAIFRRRQLPPGYALALALLLILLLDPFSVLSVGFWLSFAAVAIILFSMTGHLSAHETWWRWGRVQIAVAIGLMPLAVLFFHQHPWIGPLANLLAIPWIGFVAVPLVLLGTCLVALVPDAGGPLLAGGEWTIAVSWPWLEGLESLGWVYHTGFSPPLWTIIAAGIGVVLLLLPRGAPGRWLGALWLLPLFWVSPPRPAPGELWFTLLDVGQGLAAVARTHEHVLVYDTGPRYGPGFDAGRAVLVPFLQSRGIAFVDRLVLSHRDADHAGGLGSLLAEFPVGTVLANTAGIPATGGPVSTEHQGASTNNTAWRNATCRDGVRWRWDGVDFRFLHPPTGGKTSGNDGSCVLAITNTEGSILLTGDIQHGAERRLVRAHGDTLQADVLVVPHHGSDTSSSEAFLAKVKPRYALFSTGHRNRFGLPSEEILDRYGHTGAELLFSDRDGAIGFRLTPGKGVATPTRYRDQARHFWTAR